MNAREDITTTEQHDTQQEDEELYREKEYKQKVLILDCETKPNPNLIDLFSKNIKAPKTYKDEAKIKEYLDKKKVESVKAMSVDPDYADILCVGVKPFGEEAKIYEGKDLPEIFKKYKNYRIVTFNGKGFDFPLMIKYGIKNNLDLPYGLLKEGMRRWSTGSHLDLMEVICDGKFKSLDELLQIYLGIAKKPIDFETASDEEIKSHCLSDLCLTEELYKKFLPLFI